MSDGMCEKSPFFFAFQTHVEFHLCKPTETFILTELMNWYQICLGKEVTSSSEAVGEYCRYAEIS